MDFDLYAVFLAPIVALFVGAALNHAINSRPRVTTYLSHTSAHSVPLQDGTSVDVYTHSIVLKNSGRKAAHNVRISHITLPNYNVFPQVNFSVEELPGGASDIIIPTLVPGEQITVSYLYYPPTTWRDINGPVKSDEGFAKVLNVLPMVQYPKWFNAIMAALILVGLSTLVYLIFTAATDSW